MKLLFDDENYIIGYCSEGDIEGSIECNVELPVDINDKIGFYKLEKDKFVFNEEKFNQAKLEEEAKRKEEEEIAIQEETLKNIERKTMLMSLDDEEAYSIRYLFDEWIVDKKYKKNERIKHKRKLYKCLSEHISQADWSPDVAVSLWVEISDPNEEFPEWKQPTGAHDAYMKDSKVTFKGSKYISLIDNNVWSPEDNPSGWKKII